MKKKIVILLLIVAFGLSYVAFEARNHSEKRRRAELQILRIVETGVLDNLIRGGELPSSWLSLTNMVQWEFALRMSKDGFIPAATESYTVLSQPIPFESPSGFGSIFFIGTNPKNWPSRSLGRWALLASSNRVFRVWLPENDLPAEIRSQLTNQP